MKKFIKAVSIILTSALCLSLIACGNTKTKDKGEEEPAGEYTFFYTEELTQDELDDMITQLNHRLEALNHQDYVTLTGDIENKQIHAAYTKDADTDLFVSVFCVNNFDIKNENGDILITQDDIETVDVYYLEDDSNDSDSQKSKDTSTGFLHFIFNESGIEKMTAATENITDGMSITFCLNDDKVNETTVMEKITNEMYASGFGNLLDLFKVCINEGPLPVALYSTTALYDGQESVVVTDEDAEAGEIDANTVQPDGYITLDENTEVPTDEELPVDGIEIEDPETSTAK